MKPIRSSLGALILVLVVGCASNSATDADEKKRATRLKTHLELGVGYLGKGKYEFAEQNLIKALAIDAHHSEANNMMAVLQWRMKNLNEAKKYFARAVKYDPGNSSAYNNYGVFLCEQGNIDKAVKLFNRALKDPKYLTPAQANLNAGLCMLNKSAPVQAKQYFTEALRINPNLSLALYNMARLNYGSGKTLSARAYIQRFFAANKKDTPEALLLAIKIERALGARNAEASYALRLKNKFPDSPEASSRYVR